MKKRNYIKYNSDVLKKEKGTFRNFSGKWLALGYPSAYNVASSSLGFQTIYRILNQMDGLGCERFFFSLKGANKFFNANVAAESGRPVTSASAIGFSVACETELLTVVAMLENLGLEPLAQNRTPYNPPVIIGGPLTIVDPQLVAPLCDVVICGEGEPSLPWLARAITGTSCKEDFLAVLPNNSHGIWLPSLSKEVPAYEFATLDMLPAMAATWSPYSELRDLFLIEVARGCPRACEFCVLSRRSKGNGGFRRVQADIILQSIPGDVKGVGLVGAAVTDHPHIKEIVRQIVNSGKRVSLSSIRADMLDETLLALLVKGGLRSLTVAADGISSRLRLQIKKGITEEHLIKTAEMAGSYSLRGLKLYAMVGLPGEDESDVEEFAELLLKMSRKVKLSVAIQAFVPKPGTPLENVSMMEQGTIKKQLMLLKRLTAGRVRLISTSVRWSFIDWKIAHSGIKAAEIAIMAYKNKGSFNGWQKAIKSILKE
jgi:radical SAM superfamily enzyme YgiQ (UPF0313 family)